MILGLKGLIGQPPLLLCSSGPVHLLTTSNKYHVLDNGNIECTMEREVSNGMAREVLIGMERDVLSPIEIEVLVGMEREVLNGMEREMLNGMVRGS